MVSLSLHLLLLLSLTATLALIPNVFASSQLETLTTMRKSSRNSLLSMTVPQLRSVLENSPRPYSIFVLFTADASMCKPCAPMREQLASVSKEYSSLSKRSQARHPVFFADVKLSGSDSGFLNDYGIQHVPIFYHFSAGKTQYPRALDEKNPDYYPAQTLGIMSNSIKRFVNSRIGSSLRVIRGGYQIPFVDTVRRLMPFIAFIVFLATITTISTGAYKSPMLWFGIVVLIYIFSVGGGHYSWIHNTPLAVVNQNGGVDYIAGGSRSQYVAEGFFVSVTCVSISAFVILIQQLPFFIPNKSVQSAIGLAMVMLTVLAIGVLLTLYHFVSCHVMRCCFCANLHCYLTCAYVSLPMATETSENATILAIQRDVKLFFLLLLNKSRVHSMQGYIRLNERAVVVTCRFQTSCAAINHGFTQCFNQERQTDQLLLNSGNSGSQNVSPTTFSVPWTTKLLQQHQ